MNVDMYRCDGHGQREDAYVRARLATIVNDAVLRFWQSNRTNTRRTGEMLAKEGTVTGSPCGSYKRTNLMETRSYGFLHLQSRYVVSSLQGRYRCGTYTDDILQLSEQQYEVFKSNLPGWGIQLFSGKDNVDHWTEQSAWDAVLLNVRIVLSTHQVLLDALTHAFVKMSDLALLIFDEGGNCSVPEFRYFD
jgi:hypothetical protein